MSYKLGVSINTTATITAEAASKIDDVRCKAVKYDENGKLVLAKAGETFIGIALPNPYDSNINGTVEAGKQIDVQIKEIGFAKAGAAVAVGAALASDANGKLVTAKAGDFVIGYALTSASADEDIIQVQIAKSYYPTTA